MRRLLAFLGAMVIVGVAALMMRPVFVPGSSTNPTSTAATLWPHEIHVNYKKMNDLPVHDIREPF